ncbi:AAA family ATPase [Kitasatospora purpeofusca]|uniref:helix-turn-helix transcriptional regulator n=1 Tax=Kitasatospora purpeofusca TaxID=67352 RepID=UPI0022570356|nr:LuxR family transcriptional regulator [Kitasatospora purpeofusca]MCX4688643.1 AAA family ATPase [Kitasatospora purpeofusca]
MPSLLERDAHIDRLDHLLAECLGRAGRVALVDGPLGSGKSELLRVFAARAAERGVLVVGAGCSAQERDLPFGIADRIARSPGWPAGHAERLAALAEPALLADPAERAGGTAFRGSALDDTPLDGTSLNGASLNGTSFNGTGAVGDPAGPPSPALLRACRDLTTALLAAAADTPVLLCVEDIGHADEASLHFLRHLVRHLPQSRVLLVLTDGSTPWPARRRLHAELLRHPHAHRLALAPLSRAGALRLVTEGLGEEDARHRGPGLVDVAGGNPLLLHALVDEHLDRADDPEPRYGPALLSCLHRAGPGVLRVVQAQAVLGEEAPAEDVARLLGERESADAVARIRATLTAAGLLDDEGRLRTEAARAAVLEDLAPHERTELRLRAAQLAHETGSPAAEVARHLVEAGRAPAPWAVAALTEAAEHALLDHRLPTAVACLRLAHKEAAEENDRAVLRHRLAQAEWQLNPSVAARHLAPLTAAVRAGHLGLAEALVLVRYLLWHGRSEEALAVLDLLRARTRPASPAETGALRDIETWLAHTHPGLARGRRVPALPADLRHAVAPDVDPQLRAAAALAGALTRGRAAEAVDRAVQVLHDAHLHGRTPWAEEAALLALRVLLDAGRADTAAVWSQRLLGTAARREVPTATALYSAAHAEAALRLGEPTTAAEHSRAALTHLSPTAWGIAVGLPLGTLIVAESRTGEHRSAAKHLTHAVGEAMFQSLYGLHYLFARGEHYLATRHGHAALADFLSCGELLRTWGLDGAGVVPWRTQAADAWLRLDNRDRAWRLIHEQLSRADADLPHNRGPALRLLAAAGPAGRRGPLLTEAVDLTEASGDRYEQVRVLTDLSRVHQAAGNKRRARLLLRQALHLATMCALKPLAQELLSVSADLGESGPADDEAREPGGFGALTESERRVASLAVLGYTNREIAGRLYVTASTVEQHLTRVYRKLGVRRRKDLPADLRAGLRKTG